MTDTNRIIGLAGRGAIATLDGEAEQHEAFLVDLAFETVGAPDLEAVASAAAEALAWPADSLRSRAERIAIAVQEASAASSVEVTVQQPEVSFGVPVTAIEVTVRRQWDGAGVGAAMAPPGPVPAQAPVLAAAEEPVVVRRDSVLGAAGVAVAAAAAEPEPSEPEPYQPEPVVADLEPEPALEPEPEVSLEVEAQPAPAREWGWQLPAPAAPAAEADPAALAGGPEGEPAFPAAPAFPDPSTPTPVGASGPGIAIPWAPVRSRSVAQSPGRAASSGIDDPLTPAAVFAAPEAPPEAAQAFEPAPEPNEFAPTPPTAAAPIQQAPPPAAAPPEPQLRRPGSDAPQPGYLVLSGTGTDARTNLAGVVRALGTAAGIDVGDVSPLARMVTGAGDLHTAIVAITTTLTPGQLRQAASDACGNRAGTTAEVLSLEGVVGEIDGVELPLPGAATSAAVLTPWAQLAPGAVLPGLGGGPVAVLAETAPDRDGVKWLALDWLD